MNISHKQAAAILLRSYLERGEGARSLAYPLAMDRFLVRAEIIRSYGNVGPVTVGNVRMIRREFVALVRDLCGLLRATEPEKIAVMA